MTKTFKLKPLHILAFSIVVPMTPAVANLEVNVDTTITADTSIMADTESTSIANLEDHSLKPAPLTALEADYLTNEQADNEYNTVDPLVKNLEDTDDDLQWVDDGHKGIKNRLDKWSNKMNSWFGEPDSNEPASANLRIILDTRWVDDPITGSDITVEPRVRGRLRLPVLERRLSVIFGDDDLDEDTTLKKDLAQKVYRDEISNPDKIVDGKQIRDDNASIALSWSRFGKKLGVDTDIDVGLHSFDDLYVKVSIDKDFYEGEKLSISSDNFYRYGLDSEHYAKAALGFGYQLDDTKLINNRSIVRYRNKDDNESTTWSNDLRQVHYFGNNKQLSYGLSAFGFFDSDKESLNSYGPAISYRQPIWREWLFMQTDLNYYNNELEDKDHHATALLRFEASF